MKKSIWEILVPTTLNGVHIHPPYIHHKAWDAMVRRMTGGLTISKTNKGQWISPTGTLHSERMIPVRIMATEDEITAIAHFTLMHYNQEAVMYYKISDDVHIVHRDTPQ